MISVNILTSDVKSYGEVTVQGHRDGALANAQFRNPRQMTTDPDGNILFVDCDNHCIRKIDMKTPLRYQPYWAYPEKRLLPKTDLLMQIQNCNSPLVLPATKTALFTSLNEPVD